MTITVEALRNGCYLPGAAATEAAGEALAAALPDDTVVALQGPMGAGKTTLVRGLARGLGIHHPVTSPTYQLYHVHAGKRQLVHLDAYRLEDPAEADGLLLEECLHSPFVLVIEWPERVPTNWLEDAWRVTLAPDGEGRRLSLCVPPRD